MTNLVRILVLFAALPTNSGNLWRANLGAAQAESRGSDRMLMIDFGAAWCTPCKLMEARVSCDRSPCNFCCHQKDDLIYLTLLNLQRSLGRLPQILHQWQILRVER